MHLSDEQLMKRIEGPLGAEAEAHLGACPRCRAAAAETAAIWRLLPAETVEPSVGFDARLRARLDAEDERREGFTWAWLVPGLATAVAVAVVLTVPPPAVEEAPRGELEMLADLALYDDLEAAELVDVYADLDVIEALDEGEG